MIKIDTGNKLETCSNNSVLTKIKETYKSAKFVGWIDCFMVVEIDGQNYKLSYTHDGIIRLKPTKAKIYIPHEKTPRTKKKARDKYKR